MDHRRALVTFAAALVCSPAFAFYANLVPPAGWAAGAVTGATFQSAGATATTWINNAAKTSAMLNVGGRAVAVPTTLRLAASAGAVAARFMFLNPYVLGAVAIGWAASQKFEFRDGKWYLKEDIPGEVSTGFEYAVGSYNIWASTKPKACAQWFASRTQTQLVGDTNRFAANNPRVQFADGDDQCVYDIYDRGQFYGTRTGSDQYINKRTAPCPAGSVQVNGKCTTQTTTEREVEQEEFEDKLKEAPIPQKLPQELPIPLPVMPPVVNPPATGEPVPQPFFVPQGEPIPVPNTNPKQYTQPGVRVSPTPTTAEPWRVDVRPVDKTGTDPKGVTEPTTEPADGDPDTKPSEKDADLCVKNPDILACQKLKLGELEPKELATKTVPMAIHREEGFGPADASCPAPRSFSVMGKTFEFQWTPMCDFAHGIRPLLIGFAYLSAVLAFMGLSRKDS